ncbi:reverse transcriptase domain-containing protein [Alcanivoracaceae bacterium MT1]
MVIERHQGTPQGGPLSPLLDEVARELERRGHRFARYADDCDVYVHSRKAGERVMALLRGSYSKLRLEINESKSAVSSVFGSRFPGYALWLNRKGEVCRGVLDKALQTVKQ